MAALELRTPAELAQIERIAMHVETRFWDAGHIPGTALIEVMVGGGTLAFSVNIGPQNKSFLAQPGVDHLFGENTCDRRTWVQMALTGQRGTAPTIQLPARAWTMK